MAKVQDLDFAPSATPAPWAISLRNQEAGSDKVYNINLRPDGDLWRVDYQNGRYGSTLVGGTKTERPVPYDEAAKIATTLLKSKLKGKYRPMAMPGADEAPSYVEPNDTGVRPHLLEPIGKDDLATYLQNPSFMGQEKKDGQRRFVRCVPATGATGINRRGLEVGLPRAITDVMKEWPGRFLIDGEMVGETFWAFDLLEQDDEDLRSMPAAGRYRRLEDLFDILSRRPAFRDIGFKLVGTAWTVDEKASLLRRIMADGGEGVVFKDRKAPYIDGRNSTQVKYKLWNDLSAVAGAQKAGKRSVALHLVDDASGSQFAVGYVTIPANHAIPAPGTVVNVRYLYAYQDGSLFQPQYEGVRDDVTQDQCVASQRVFVPQASMAEPVAEEPEPGMN